VLSTQAHPALRGAIYGATFLAVFAFAGNFFPASGPPLVAPPLVHLLVSTALSILQGALAGAAYGFVLGRAVRGSFGTHVRAGIAGGAVFTLPLLIAARHQLSGRWSLLLLIAIGGATGALLGSLIWLQDFAGRGKPAA
jgi:hypothetical protein